MTFEYPQIIEEGGKSYLGANLLPAPVRDTMVQITTHPDADKSPVWKKRAVEAGFGAKTLTPSPVWNRNVYGWCDAIELGYTLQPAVLCGQELLDWFDPAIVIDTRELTIPIRDMRAWGGYTAATGSLQAILCGTAPTCAPTHPAIGGLDLRYCFDFDRVRYVCVGAADINAFIKECKRNAPLNLFGQAVDTTTANGMLAFENLLLTQKARNAMLTDSLALIPDFFDNFVDRHPELATRTDLQPRELDLPDYPTGTPTQEQIDTWFDSVLTAIYNRRREIRELLRRCGIEGNPTGEVLMMNWRDAMCIQWAQACILSRCYIPSRVSFAITPGEFTSAQQASMEEFYNRFRIGQYGAGRIYFRDGSWIDIWASEDCQNMGGALPQGTAYLLYKGWDGPQANNNAFRLITMQWGEMVDYYRSRSPIAAQLIQPFSNATGLKVLPNNGCGDVYLAWNQYLMSNAPFMQTRITGFQLCAEENWSVTCFPALPAISQAVLCTQNIHS